MTQVYRLPKKIIHDINELIKDYEYFYPIVDKVIAKKGDEIHIFDEMFNIKHVIKSNKSIEEFIELLIN